MKTIKLPAPSWKTAASIYIAVLENRNASEKGKDAAREELMRLAENMDLMIASRDAFFKYS